MNKSETIGELAKALSKFQSEVKQPLKDKTNPFFKSKYVPLENVVEVITQTAPKFGLSFIQYPTSQDNKIGVITVLMHESGEFIETDPIYVTPGKYDAQAAGSVITYLKRYSLSAVFGITSDNDDDGNKASETFTVTTPTFTEVLKNVAGKLNRTQQDIYKEVTSQLNINKSTKELSDQEKKAITSILIKL